MPPEHGQPFDSTLTAIAEARPSRRVPGVGESKLRKCGEEVLEILPAEYDVRYGSGRTVP
jgi:hypothetical protein